MDWVSDSLSPPPMLCPPSQNSIRGSYKRAVGLAAVNCISQLGNISGVSLCCRGGVCRPSDCERPRQSYVWPSKWGPSYWRSNLISACCFLVSIAAAVAIRYVLSQRNKELDRVYGSAQHSKQSGQPDTIDEEGTGNMRDSMDARTSYRYLV